MRIFRITSGVSLILFSLLACGLSFIAIIDPVGTKMADDNDPFGPPPSRVCSLCKLCIYFGVGAAAVYIIRRPSRSKPDSNATKIA